MRYCVLLAAVLTVLMVVADGAAKTWTSGDRKFSTEAELVGVEAGKILLWKTDGQLVAVPVGKLCDADQQYVKAYAARPAADAPAGDVQPRTWTSQCGKFSTGAGLVGFKAGQVLLRKTNGKLLTVPLENLSDADRQYVNGRAAGANSGAKEAAGNESSESGAGPTAPQTCALELKRLKPLKPAGGLASRPPADSIYRMVRPRYFFMQTGPGRTDRTAAAFSRIVKKEPAEYESEHPFRGLVSLGGRPYGFVLDLTVSQPNPADAKRGSAPAEFKGRGRLYFDLNHNGDLTDDQVIEAEQSRGNSSSSSSWGEFSSPRVDLTLDANGAKLDYAFFLNARLQTSKDRVYASATLSAAAYREGRIRLDGKSVRIVLLDYNSNGRFDDVHKVRESSGRVYPTYGDTLLVDPGSGDRNDRYGDETAGQYVSKLANVGGRYYLVEISAANDQLTLTPDSTPVGYVTHASEGFHGVFYNGKGVVKVGGSQAKPAALPEGTWKLASYTIYHAGKQGPTRGSAARRALASQVSAQATEDCKPIEVRRGETLALPFGPPYTPVVKASSSLRGGQPLGLAMSLLGSGGEVCTGLLVNGRRPEKPAFTISTPDGQEVASGNFEWG